MKPLAQQESLVEWLKTREPEVWQWQADSERRIPDVEFRLGLLRDTYRMNAESHPEVFESIRVAQDALGLQDIVISVYQGQNDSLSNARICYLPGEAHVIFSGPILTLLSAEELTAVIGHELAHYLLWQMREGDFYRADRILSHAAAHVMAKGSHIESARLWALATEFFADRGAYLACGSLETAVATLAKTSTGLHHVSGQSYLAQAEEIFAKSKPKTEGVTHPELFMRARALQLWVTHPEECDAAIVQMLENEESLDGLDLIQQAKLTALTRRFIVNHLRPQWFQSEAVMAHARLFFPGLEIEGTADELLDGELADLSKARREYLCHVLLDFCAVDPELEMMPVAAAIVQARKLECLSHFEKIATRELKLRAKDLKNLKDNADSLLANPMNIKP